MKKKQDRSKELLNRGFSLISKITILILLFLIMKIMIICVTVYTFDNILFILKNNQSLWSFKGILNLWIFSCAGYHFIYSNRFNGIFIKSFRVNKLRKKFKQYWKEIEKAEGDE